MIAFTFIWGRVFFTAFPRRQGREEPTYDASDQGAHDEPRTGTVALNRGCQRKCPTCCGAPTSYRDATQHQERHVKKSSQNFTLFLKFCFYLHLLTRPRCFSSSIICHWSHQCIKTLSITGLIHPSPSLFLFYAIGIGKNCFTVTLSIFLLHFFPNWARFIL